MNEIINRILSDPSVRELLVSKSDAKQTRPEILVLLNYSSDLVGLLMSIREALAQQYDIKVMGSDAVMRNKPVLPEGLCWLAPEKACRQGFHRLLLPNCSANTLAKIALGLRDSLLCEMAARAIIEGVPVEVIPNLGFSARTPQAYQKLFEDYIKVLQSFGITIRSSLSQVGMSGLVSILGSAAAEEKQEAAATSSSLKTGSAEEPDDQRIIRWKKRLITEGDAAMIPAHSTLSMPRNTVISPLAKDRLRERKIEILREGDGLL